MSSITTSNKPAIPSTIFPKICCNVEALIFGGLAVRDIEAALCVNRLWRSSPLLQRLLEDGSALEKGWNLGFVKTLRERGMALLRLPIFDMNGYQGGEIRDYLAVSSEGELLPLSSNGVDRIALAQFQDSRGRLGLILRARGRDLPLPPITVRTENIHIQDFSTMVTIHQRRPREGSWVNAVDEEAQLSKFYNLEHQPSHVGDPLERCPTCISCDNPAAGSLGAPDLFQRLIRGIDPILTLSGRLEMVPRSIPKVAAPAKTAGAAAAAS